uniref:Uncharacterized protein n=1 Tax=Syphacia muris TaxID=451379 RepID=A0A0N5AS23_9BILA
MLMDTVTKEYRLVQDLWICDIMLFDVKEVINMASHVAKTILSSSPPPLSSSRSSSRCCQHCHRRSQ